MDPVENRGRSKFFKCFKPVFSDDELGFNSVSPPSSDSESSFRRKKRAHRSFSGVMKAVFFKMSLAKKLRSKKCRQDSFRSNSNSSPKNENFVNTKKNSSYMEFSDPEQIFRTNSHGSSLFSRSVADSSRSSSRASSISSNSRSGSERIKQSASIDLNTINRPQAMRKDGDNVKLNYSPTIGMCSCLVCLVTLVFWGKVFAIVTCTSTWLFFAPGRRRRFQSVSVVELPVSNMVDSEEYKKRVIMEGFLERNRPRVLYS